MNRDYMTNVDKERINKKEVKLLENTYDKGLIKKIALVHFR